MRPVLRILTIVLVLIFTNHYCFAGETNGKSRIAVVDNGNKTRIWVSDFPRKTSVVVTDSENNLLTIVSTNDFGAAYIILPVSVKSRVIVKTLNGEVSASNNNLVNDKNLETDLPTIAADGEMTKA